jgi:DNA repair protein RadD
MATLRPYQAEAVAAVYDHLRNRSDNPCIVLPTGTGKSHVIAQICHDAVRVWCGRVVVLAQVKELLEQNAAKIAGLLPADMVGVYSAGLNSRDTEHPVIVAGIQSVYQRAGELGPFDLALVDEAHLIPPDGEGMYRRFLEDAGKVCDHLRVIGLTATPYRLQGGVICRDENMLNAVCYEAGLREMIAQGYLSPIRSRSGKSPVDLSGVHHRGGEFVADEMAAAFDTVDVTRAAVDEAVRLTKDRRSILVFAASVEHCQHVAEALAERTGEPVGVITGETPAGERKDTLARFRGECRAVDLLGTLEPPLRWLVNVNVLTTGFDAPNIDAIVLLRATESPGLLVQMCGRGLRLCEGKKDCIVLDYGQNILRHGPLDGIQPPKDKQKRDGEPQEPAGKVCPNADCRNVVHVAVRRCELCGYEWPPPPIPIGYRADGTPIMQGDVKDEEHEITSVMYRRHEKRNAPDAPPTMRVDYYDGLAVAASEWVCLEHAGYARSKAMRWWQVRSFAQCPATVDAAVLIAPGALATPERITVRTMAGVRFPEIIDYRLGDIPEYTITPEHAAELTATTPAATFDDWAADQIDDEIPF